MLSSRRSRTTRAGGTPPPGPPVAGGGRFPTPGAPEVQSLLAEMVEAGCGFAVLEATSHGLALHRLDGCEFDVAAMTNVGRDHMDFPRSRGEDLAAKGSPLRLLGA